MDWAVGCVGVVKTESLMIIPTSFLQILFFFARHSESIVGLNSVQVANLVHFASRAWQGAPDVIGMLPNSM